MNPARKADQALSLEFSRQKILVYGAAGVVLRAYGWGRRRFQALIDETVRLWKDCGKDNSVSMMQMLSEATGIEIQTRDGRSWEDLAYLNSTINPGAITLPKYIYMRQQQVKWVRPQILACLLLAMHNLHGYGYDRGTRFINDITDTQIEHRRDPKALRQACTEAYGADLLTVLD